MTDLFDLFTREPASFVVTAFLLSLLVGSFLNVVIYRVPLMLEKQWHLQCRELLAEDGEEVRPEGERFDLLWPGSSCPHCGHKIRAWENVPVFSYLLLGGKCSQCKVKISIRYPLIELLTAVMSAYVAYHFGFGAQAAAGILLTWVLLALTFIDFDTQLLPDSITLPFIWVGLLISLNHAFVDTPTAVLGAVFGYLSLWTVFHLFKMVTGKEGMGFGDFKLLALLGAWLGWQMLPVVILLSSFVGATIGIMLIVYRKHHADIPIPFGPYLALAGWLAMLWGHDMIDTYLAFAGWR